MTKAERTEQLAASSMFRTDAGHTGYLRAAIGMKRENALLRFVFPAKYWYNTGHEPIPFDFKTGLLTLNKGVKIYLRSIKEVTEPAFRSYGQVTGIERTTDELAKKTGLQTIAAAEELGLDNAVEWLLGVADFFDLGVKKTDEGRNPRILIIW